MRGFLSDHPTLRGFLVISSLAWAGIGFALFGFLLSDSSAADGAAIALFLFLVPWLFCGGLVLLLRQRRHGQRTVNQR